MLLRLQGCRQYLSAECYLPVSPHGAVTHKTNLYIFIAVRTLFLFIYIYINSLSPSCSHVILSNHIKFEIKCIYEATMQKSVKGLLILFFPTVSATSNGFTS
jgi:hypothetical protein